MTLSSRRRGTTAGALALAVGLALVGVGAAAVQSPAGAAPAYAVDWGPCPGEDAGAGAAVPGSTRCGTLRVPVDWASPRGATTTLAVVRRTAGDPASRVGTLFYNPGGPGDGGVKYVRSAADIFSPTLLARFDVVAMDPRGVEGSSPVVCSVPARTADDTFFPRTQAQFDRLRAHNRALGLSCLREHGELARHLDTASVARDHEALRRALHARQVSWLAISYGTQVAANEAELFPGTVRAMVLDAALEHSGSEVGMLADGIRTAEDAFERFAAWCDTAPECALRGRDVAALYDDLVARADRDPIPVAGAVRAVTGEDIRMGTPRRLTLTAPSIYGPEISWPGLSRALAAALEGDASGFAVFLGQEPPALGPIACLDYDSDVGSWADMQERIVMGRAMAPHLQGASELWNVVRCIGWPVPAANPLRRLDVRGVPALLVHAVHDASDAYEWAFGLASQVQGSRVLTRAGDGHTSYYTSACARAASDRFLLYPVPPRDRVCSERTTPPEALS